MKTKNLFCLKRLALWVALCCVIPLLTACSSWNDDWNNASPLIAPQPPGSFLSLCYHNVEDDDPDQRFDGVSTSHLIEQMSWLKHEGYTPISINDLLAARAGKKPLPPKAVLLTFDDGYKSFYTRVYPILKAYHYPAVIGIVDEWMKGGSSGAGHPGDRVRYGETTMPRSAFLTWAEVREMKKSGLIEIASHSHALHYGTVANPQGNTEPVAVSQAYNSKTDTYETPQHYQQKLEDDAEESARTIEKETGSRPRVMIWPYGAYNQISVAVEKRHGMPITLTLDDGYANVNNLSAVPRFLVKDDPNLEDFAINIRQIGRPNPMRAIQVDLDYIYDDDQEQMDRNIDALVSRVHDMKISTVFLQAFADPEGTGLASETYFPNRVLPMRADLFNRVAWQLNTRDDVKVFGWLPVMSFDLGSRATPVMAWNPETDESAPAEKGYRRTSIFDPRARHLIEELYEDMSKYGPIDGILFHDDALLSDFEDASPAALKAYQKAGLPGSIEEIRANPELMDKWTAFKTQALIDFTKDLTRVASRYHAPLVTVRNIYAPLILNPNSEEWFAQDYKLFLKNYDYTAIEAMPEMENVPDADADAWFAKLVKTAKNADPEALKRTFFELQAVDWRKAKEGEDRTIPTEVLGKQMRYLALHSAMNFGYYPDDFATNTPDESVLHKDFSLQAYPYRP
jgi:biofilm PGA synthesis lipoprotein PgaB